MGSFVKTRQVHNLARPSWVDAKEGNGDCGAGRRQGRADLRPELQQEVLEAVDGDRPDVGVGMLLAGISLPWNGSYMHRS